MPFLPPPQSRKKGSPAFLLLAHLTKGVEEPGAGKDDRTRIPKRNRKKMKLRPGVTFPHASEPPPGERRPHSFPPGQQHQKRGWEQVPATLFPPDRICLLIILKRKGKRKEKEKKK